MRDHFEDHALWKQNMCAAIYGFGYMRTVERSRFNPFRYLMKRWTMKFVEPSKIFKNPEAR